MSRPLTLRLTDTAEADLAEIWFYVALEASEAIAKRFIDKIKGDCEPLRHFPLIGPARDHFAPGLRVSFSGNRAWLTKEFGVKFSTLSELVQRLAA